MWQLTICLNESVVLIQKYEALGKIPKFGLRNIFACTR